MKKLALLFFVLPFTSLAEEIRPSENNFSKYTLELRAQLNLMSPTLANSRIRVMNAGVSTPKYAKAFGTSGSYELGAFYHFNEDLSLGAYLSHIGDSSTGSGSLGGDGIISDFLMGGNSVGIEPRYRVAKISEKFDLTAFFKGGYTFYYFWESATNDASYKASAAGIQLAAGAMAHYHLSKTLDILGSVGYRINKSDNIIVDEKTTGATGVTVGSTLTTASGSKTQVDLTCVFIELGLTYHL